MSDPRQQDIHLQVCLKAAAWWCANQQFDNPAHYRQTLIKTTEAVFNDYEVLTAKLIPQSGSGGTVQQQPRKQPPFQNNQQSNVTQPLQNQGHGNQGTHPSQVSDASKSIKCNKCGDPIKWGKVNGKNTPRNMDGSSHFDTCQADAGESYDPAGPQWNTGSSECNKCSATIWWKKAKESGKSYPVNQDGGYHSETCGEQNWQDNDQSQQMQTTQDGTAYDRDADRYAEQANENEDYINDIPF